MMRGEPGFIREYVTLLFRDTFCSHPQKLVCFIQLWLKYLKSFKLVGRLIHIFLTGSNTNTQACGFLGKTCLPIHLNMCPVLPVSALPLPWSPVFQATLLYFEICEVQYGVVWAQSKALSHFKWGSGRKRLDMTPGKIGGRKTGNWKRGKKNICQVCLHSLLSCSFCNKYYNIVICILDSCYL